MTRTSTCLRGCLGLLVLAMVSPSVAADGPTPSPLVAAVPGSNWAFGLNSYTWATSIDGRFRTLPPGSAVDLHLGFADILDHLDGAAMVSAEARNGRFVLFADLMGSKISAGKKFTARGYPGQVSLASSSVVGLAAAGYRVIDEPTVQVDLLAGLRGFALSNSIDVTVAPHTLSYAKDRQWVDAVAGARVAWTLSDRMSATAMGFAGAGGANYEWDVFGGVGYRFTGTISGFAGYRAMKVDYERGSFVYDALQYGPLLGMRVNF